MGYYVNEKGFYMPLGPLGEWAWLGVDLYELSLPLSLLSVPSSTLCRLESFRALNLSRLESFRVPKPTARLKSFWALKLTRLSLVFPLPSKCHMSGCEH